MSTIIKWSLDVQINGGLRISSSRCINVHAYDKIDVTIPKAIGNSPGSAIVEVQPSESAEQLKFLLISADQYSENLTYEVVGSSVSPIALDAQQLIVGSGAIGLLGASPKNLQFSNGVDKEISVQILVGRDATSQPQ